MGLRTYGMGEEGGGGGEGGYRGERSGGGEGELRGGPRREHRVVW